jgi:hypothetical protein
MTNDMFDWEGQDQYFLMIKDEDIGDWYVHCVYNDYSQAHIAATKYPDCDVRIITGRITLEILAEEPYDLEN